ncbi:MAG: hypothetical protein FH761_05840 [Firmicutes bacterium]|nr:hypothetical protein [Bacillota bacterium]
MIIYIVIVSRIPRRGTFDELVLNGIKSDESSIQSEQSKDSTMLRISKSNPINTKLEDKYDYNDKRIDEFVSSFSNLYLIERSNNSEVDIIDPDYMISFYSNNGGFDIWIYPPRYLQINTRRSNEKEKPEGLVKYEVKKGTIDIEYIENYFEALKERRELN